MIIASTAHFAKFAPAISEYLEVEYDENKPAEMFSSLLKKSPRMEMHPDLRHLFTKEILYTDTVEANKSKIIKKIVEFIEEK